MNNCNYYAELISRMIDGELSDSELTELRGHIAGCADCSAMFEAFSAVSDAVSGDMEEPPERISENVMAHVRRDAVMKKNTRKKAAVRRVLSTAACLALVFVAAYTVMTRIGVDNAAPMMAKADSAYRQKTAAAGAHDAAEAEEADGMLPESAVRFAAPAPQPAAPAAVEPADAGPDKESFDTYQLTPYQFELLMELLGDATFAADPGAGQVYRFISDAKDVCDVYFDGTVLYFSLNGDETPYLAACGLEDVENYILTLG